MAEKILVWNARGLNAHSHHNAVHELVIAECASLVCLQETKFECISDFDVIQLLCAGFDYYFLPVVQMRGGILEAWRASSWATSATSSRQYSVSIRLQHM
jgi:exonuclease III